ncbi:DUF305 domain-containing protein [Pseudarthrobacter albicanus]|uniref:DUF305 domain-containing protein n=1 Tax=Pseudarthrobacter albicanus TaxID=2823873 RepID=UPI0027DDF61C|nr:DUF305 domain-containing protein [Pseudarthrobacter albicanus]
MSAEAAAAGTAGSRVRRPLAVLAAVVLAILAGWALGRLSAPASAFPPGGTVEAGFARDMQVHHLQAVEMSMLVRDRTDDPDIRRLAYDIARSQQQQAGQMFGWLSVWGLPQASTAPAMAWMTDGGGPSAHDGGHAAHGSGADASTPTTETLMPGMATPAELAALEASTGAAAERLYLELMIRHHQAGVAMARAVLDRSDNVAVTSLARSVVTAQQSEIDYMFELLTAR